MPDFDQQNQKVNAQINIAGDINNPFDSQRDEQFRIALNWDKKTSLREFDLSNRNLSGINLKNCDLSGAILEDADLSNTNLQGADLSKTNLRGANLDNANLKLAVLKESDLTDTNITDRQFLVAKSLQWAIMPDNKLYNGRFLLCGDMDEWAKKHDLSKYFRDFPLSEDSEDHVKETAFVFFTKVQSIYEEIYKAGDIAAEKAGKKAGDKTGKIITTYKTSMDDFMEGQHWAKENDIQLILVRVKRRREAEGQSEPEKLKNYIHDFEQWCDKEKVPFIDFSIIRHCRAPKFPLHFSRPHVPLLVSTMC